MHTFIEHSMHLANGNPEWDEMKASNIHPLIIVVTATAMTTTTSTTKIPFVIYSIWFTLKMAVCVKLHRTTWNWNSNCRAISSVKTHIFSILVNFVVFQSNIVSYIVTQNAIWLNRNDKMYQTMRCISIFVSTIDTTNEHFQIMWLDQNENSIVTNSEELFGIYKMHHWFAIIVANADCKHTNPLNSMQ